MESGMKLCFPLNCQLHDTPTAIPSDLGLGPSRLVVSARQLSTSPRSIAVGGTIKLIITVTNRGSQLGVTLVHDLEVLRGAQSPSLDGGGGGKYGTALPGTKIDHCSVQQRLAH